jgi:excisionase family DNA binding protein
VTLTTRATYKEKETDDVEEGPNSALELPSGQILLPCFLLLPQDAAPILAQLRNVAPSQITGGPVAAAAVPSISVPQPQEDSWLDHSDAADYLGVAKSTLYRYTCEQRIESRKLGGRLEYRRSTLEKFKNQQIRPARNFRARGIIAPALGSGN